MSQEIAEVSETAAFVQMVERAAANPSVDVDKLERLLAMRERMEMRTAEHLFNEAMAKAQKEMEPVRTNASNLQTKSEYATYAALDRALRPTYSKHGFALSFDTGDGAPEGCVRVMCYLSCAGYTRTYHADMPADGKGAKGGDVMTKTHAMGSAFTYGQRYLLRLMFNIAVLGKDDDGNQASGMELVTPEQAAKLEALIIEVGADRAKFLAAIKVEALSDIYANKFDAAVALLEKKRKVSA